MSNSSVIRFDDPHGGLVYPFLLDEWQWQIVTRPLDLNADSAGATLRWVKDDKVVDLIVPGMDSAAFLAHTGLRPSLARGGYVLSKRLSRIMRPYHFCGFFDATEIDICHSAELDKALWDGCGLISRTMVERLAQASHLHERHHRALLATRRFEVTLLHGRGQEKGHVLVVDDLVHDFVFPAGSTKPELALADGRLFVGLLPVHSQDEVCLDVQSLINLYPFFQPEHLLAWAQLESNLFLDGIRSGRLEALWNRLAMMRSAADLDPGSAGAAWPAGEFIASGGRLMWFAGMVKAVARQHLNRLGRRQEKLRFPIPAGRYYIFPAEVGGREVPPGHIELDPATATAWVNDQDWLETITSVLGGCDGDDALWVLPFTDLADRQRKVLVWRSPNQLGEYVLLRPTEASHQLTWAVPGGYIAYPALDSRRLPPRVDRVGYTYGQLDGCRAEGMSDELNRHATYSSSRTPHYSIAAMRPVIQQAAANRGVLGSYVNLLMVTKALYGRLPNHLPATLEAVIDGSVMTGASLKPVRAWAERAAAAIIRQGKAIPSALAERLLPLLDSQSQSQLQTSQGHWLDTLLAAMAEHQATYWANVEALATECCPPLELFEHGRDWLTVGKEVRQVYGRVMRQTAPAEESVDENPFEAARAASEAFLNRWPAGKRVCVLLGTAAYLYAPGPQHGEPVHDALLWQLGGKPDHGGREPGIAQVMFEALRQIGVLGEPVWTAEGAILHYRDQPCPQCAGVPVTLAGVWYNYLRATRPHTPGTMSQVPKTEREQAKVLVAALAQNQWHGLTLTSEVTPDERVVTRTPQGNLFGYVRRDQELLAVRHRQWRIVWATAFDGNVQAILQAVA